MNVLERYAKLLENAGIDTSKIETRIYDDAEIPYIDHCLQQSFDDKDYVSLLLTEDGKIAIDNLITQRPFNERSLVRHIRLEPESYWLGLHFVYKDIVLEHAIGMYINASGKIGYHPNIEEAPGVEVNRDENAKGINLGRINTSEGADFEPVAKRMIELYQSVSLDPEKYVRKAA